MSIYLDRLLPVFAFPLGLALALCLIALGLSIAGRHFASRIVLAVMILGLWVASMPAFAGLITATLEDQNPPIAVAVAPAADVIIVLGGGLAAPRAELTEAGLGQAADRLGQAYALWRAGKGKLILISGGNLPWAHLPRPEAELAQAVLQQLGVPADLILVEGQSRNTRENALNTASLWLEATKAERTALVCAPAARRPSPALMAAPGARATGGTERPTTIAYELDTGAIKAIGAPWKAFAQRWLRQIEQVRSAAPPAKVPWRGFFGAPHRPFALNGL
jgi:uncharacterized SAM-binding protein YcdF (DUF218 family)